MRPTTKSRIKAQIQQKLPRIVEVVEKKEQREFIVRLNGADKVVVEWGGSTERHYAETFATDAALELETHGQLAPSTPEYYGHKVALSLTNGRRVCLKSPDGEIFVGIDNLSAFARKYIKEAPHPWAAAKGLSALASGKLNSYYGWTIVKDEASTEV